MRRSRYFSTGEVGRSGNVVTGVWAVTGDARYYALSDLVSDPAQPFAGGRQTRRGAHSAAVRQPPMPSAHLVGYTRVAACATVRAPGTGGPQQARISELPPPKCRVPPLSQEHPQRRQM
jgi:hypothetical protein